MQIQMGIVGQPNVTVTAFMTQEEQLVEETKVAKGKKERPMDRVAFDEARTRFASDGAEGVRYFKA